LATLDNTTPAAGAMQISEISGVSCVTFFNIFAVQGVSLSVELTDQIVPPAPWVGGGRAAPGAGGAVCGGANVALAGTVVSRRISSSSTDGNGAP